MAFLTALGALVALLAAAYTHLFIYKQWTLPCRNVKGPEPVSLLFGNLLHLVRHHDLAQQMADWAKIYGHTYRYRVLLGKPRICTIDPAAINYILSHTEIFVKPSAGRKYLASFLGNGLLVAEGADHKRQRRVLNQCFNQQAIKDLLPIFYDKAEELSEKLLGLVEEDPQNEAAPTPTKPEGIQIGGRKIDVMKYIAMCTIDIIGLAGFGYELDSLSGTKNEMADAFKKMFSSFGPLAIVQALIPGASLIPTKNMKDRRASLATTERVGRRLLAERKAAVHADHVESVNKIDVVGKDLLSVCVRANMAADLKPENRLSDKEVLDQISTFMFAGNETTSTALTWTLSLLSRHPEIQDQLREECLAVSTPRPSFEEISAMPILAGVVHEGLRLYPPVPVLIQEAQQDTIIPLDTPIEGRNGQMMDHIKVSKGTAFTTAYSNVHCAERTWGTDAASFRPSRHFQAKAESEGKGSEASAGGVWGNILTFSGGVRGCIGYLILFVLIRAMVFEELKSKPQFRKAIAVVMRPEVVGEKEAGVQMPLMVRPVQVEKA